MCGVGSFTSFAPMDEEIPVSCTFDEFIDQCSKKYMKSIYVDKNNHFRQGCFERKKRAAQQLAMDTTDLDATPFMYDPDYTAPVSENFY